MKGMVAEKLLPYPCLMREEGTGEERVFIYPSREQKEGTGEERLFIYPCREREEGTGEERLRLYPRQKREEGTKDEKPLIYPCWGQLAYKMPEVSDLQVENFSKLDTFRHGSPKLIERICCFSSNVCYNIDS